VYPSVSWAARGGRAGRVTIAALAAVWLILVLIVDLATGPAVRLGGLYAMAPLIACAALPPGLTAAYAVVAIVLGVASGWWNHAASASLTTVRLLDLVLVSGAAVAVSAVRVRREAQHARVVALAEVAQRAILPLLPTRVGWVTTAARYEAADEDALVGGDLYDCFWAPGLTRFVIGDVRGKGVKAVEQAARVIRAFRQAAASAPTLNAVATHMSSYLAGFLEEGGEDFVTALLVEISAPSFITVVACGHPAPLLIAPNGTATMPDLPAGLPLGWGVTYLPTTVSWATGDRVLLYTDGLVEARDARGDFLPLLTCASRLAAGGVESAADSLLAILRRHVCGARLPDDLAFLLLENAGVDAGLPARTVDRQIAELAIAISDERAEPEPATTFVQL